MFILALLACAWAEWSLYTAIRRQAGDDEARPADAIVVFGAAEYNGAPSPVFKARLDHALELEDRDLAPAIITTGGSGGDPHFTEGGVARDYLIQQGVAEDKIFSETRSDTTYESVQGRRANPQAAPCPHLHRRQRRLSPLPHQADVPRRGNYRLRLARPR